MSQAFIREGDDQWLGDIPPTMNALLRFLTRENNGVEVYEKSTSTDRNGNTVYEMSNGLKYIKRDGHWEVFT